MTSIVLERETVQNIFFSEQGKPIDCR